ncbi:Brefeldin A-inhibited guanine nucleotide-exchange protein [Dorcoceras hygrometricum]|uniref:Brefeldin A-inhibited guanine nucleotide-exchange protein n=1 Tax=Dorcoceras hygrometricum TaxID=472368 RepID=A0A2Z7D3D6_9LAMI|nr:Brefeldin A-inhibited guanine nucleotide-exchange protein [Dorcoceras hygrometricum]
MSLRRFRSCQNSSALLVQTDGGLVFPVVDLIKEGLPPPTLKCQIPCESGRSQTPASPKSNTGEFKALQPLKILSVNSVGTYVTENKFVSTAAEKVTEEPVVAKVVPAASKRRPAPAAEPMAKKRRTTVGELLPQ